MKSLACLFALLSLAPLAAAQAPAAPAKAPAPKLGSAVFDWNNLKPEERANGQRRAVLDNPTETLSRLECHITTLKPGESSGPAHAHPGVEEITFVKDGTVEVGINDTKQTIGPGSVFYFASKDLGAIRNVGAGPATYVVVSIRVAPAAAK